MIQQNNEFQKTHDIKQKMSSSLTLKQNKIYKQRYQMSSSHLTVDSIIRKYEQRQTQLAQSLTLDQLNDIETDRDIRPYDKGFRSGIETPAFSDFSNRKEQKKIDQYIQRTHKKEPTQLFTAQPINSFPYKCQLSSKQDYEKILRKLDQTEDKLAQAERNYAEIWRKYELLLKEGRKSEKSVEIQQQLRGKQTFELNERIKILQKENLNLKQCLKSKETNLSILREKLQEKNERYVESQKIIDSMKTEINSLTLKQTKISHQEDLKKRQREQLVQKLRNELTRFEDLMEGKEKEKKELLLEMEHNYVSHKEELQVLKMSYSKVEEQYKEWIEECKKQKITLIQEYEAKLKKYQKDKISSSQNFVDSLKQQILNKNQQIQQAMSQNMKLNSDIKQIKEELEISQTVRKQLIIKVSTLENRVIDKLDQQRSQEQNVSRLQATKRSDQEKLKVITQKYNTINSQLQQLKAKHNQVVEQIEQRKHSRRNEAQEIIRLKKELETVREQLEKSRNNQISTSNKLSEALSSFKKKNHKVEEEKHQLMTQFMAEKLQAARLREQLQETKVHLKRQYELSLENTKKQLEQKIKVNLNPLPSSCSLEKEQLYMQLRQLQRRYELLASEIVSVEDVMSIAAKVQKRYQSKQ